MVNTASELVVRQNGMGFLDPKSQKRYEHCSDRDNLRGHDPSRAVGESVHRMHKERFTHQCRLLHSPNGNIIRK